MLEVARVEDELAATLVRLAQGNITRSDELRAPAVASGRYAESERETARRYMSE